MRYLAALLVVAAPLLVEAKFAEQPLIDTVISAEVIVDARIVSARAETWRGDGRSGTCGYNYEARAAETLKGKVSESFSFSSDAPLAPNQRVLLFLTRYEDDFPRDHFFSENIERLRKPCVKGLAPLKVSFLHIAKFVGYDHAPAVHLTDDTAFPDDLCVTYLKISQVRVDGKPTAFDIPIEAPSIASDLYDPYLGVQPVVPWPTLREWLLKTLGRNVR